VADEISQRELCNDNAAVLRRVLAGESFVVTHNGKPVADLVPHRSAAPSRRRSLGDVQAAFRALPPLDGQEWLADLGADDPSVDPCARGAGEPTA